MAEWILYILMVSLLLSAAAWIAERSARLSRRSTRWIWLLSVIASLAIPSIISSVSIQVPSIVTPSISQHAITLRDNTVAAISPNVWMREVVSAPTLIQWDRLIQIAWMALSAALLILILASAIHISWRKRQWSEGKFMGVAVYLSVDTGPAVVGLINPKIVIPQWITQSATIDKSMVIAHEQSHLHAGDQRLLTIALCLLVLMPWNIPLWWQLKRLRHAIEVDCDSRVLREGREAVSYGETLIAVGQRQSSFVGAVAAMSESPSFLEQRITIMMRKPSRIGSIFAVLLTGLALSVAAIAVEVSPPDAKSSTAAHAERKVTSSVLDRYVGNYQFITNSVLTITRKDEHLFAQLTGQGTAEIFPESEKKFFYKVVDAQITFETDDKGGATGLILHQNGQTLHMNHITEATASQIQDAVALKVRSQTPDPRSETILRQFIADVESGANTYAYMSSDLRNATLQQLPVFKERLAAMGKVTAVEFRGVGSQGWDLFEVRHERGMTMVRMFVDSSGIVTGMLLSAGP